MSARMPWDGDISHTKLSDGRNVLRGSREEAVDRYGEELVKELINERETLQGFEKGSGSRLSD